MRNAWAIAMLMLYLSLVVRPALPSLIYLTEQDYFASELCRFKSEPRSCCKGSCQIGRMARETAGETTENPVSRILAEEFLVMLPHEMPLACAAGQFSQKWIPELILPLSGGNERAIWHPPTAQV
jgi:hypothetical protein